MKNSESGFARGFAEGMAAIGAVCFLMGCGGQGEPVASEAGISGVGSAKDAVRSITLFTWEEYFDPELLQQFEDQTGITVEYETFGSTDEMEAQIRSYPGKYDVIVADDFVLSRMNEVALLQELDHEQLPNLVHIAEKYRHLPFDEGNRFSVPYVWGSTLVAYRTDKVKDPQQSWNLLWDDALKGRVMMVQESFEPFVLAMLSMGIKPNSQNQEDYDKAVSKLIDQVARVEVRYGDDTDIKDGLISGEVWAAMCYSGDAGIVAEEEENVDFFIPDEGAPLWIDNFALTRDSSKRDAVHLFINFMLEPTVAAASSNFTWCATPNAAALPLIDEELKEDERIFPSEEIEKRCVFLDPTDAVRERLINAGWASVQRKLRIRESSEEVSPTTVSE